jgi:alpha-beta hydrolase superfamily lysophospholipase
MKETIVFVHGMSHGAWCWEEYFIPYFEKMGYTCLAINLPGHAEKGSTKSISFSLAEYVRSLTNVVANLPEPPIIIGHSMGGMILQRFLKTGTCKKAILMSSVPPAGVLMASLRVIFRHLGSIPFLFQRNLLGVFHKYPELMFADKSVAQKFKSNLCAESFIAYLGLLIPISNQTSTPMLVIGGSADALITQDEFRQTAKYYQAKLELIEGGSHDLMLDPDFTKTADTIQQWLTH